MLRSPHSASCFAHAARSRTLAFARCVLAVSCFPLHAQTTGPAPTQAPPATFPADRSPDAPEPKSGAAPKAPGSLAAATPLSNVQDRLISPVPPLAASASPRGWEASVQDLPIPFYAFNAFSAPTPGGAGFNSSGGFSSGRMDAGAFGVHQPASHAYNPFASAGTGVRQPGVAPLFPSRGAPTHGLPGGYSGFAVSPAAVPTLDQMLRGSFNLPLNSSAGSLRFTYQDFLRPGASFAGLDHPAASLMFSTSGLANGVVLSAGTTFGSHSVAGTPAATLNGTAVGPPKSSGPSLNLKLSF